MRESGLWFVATAALVMAAAPVDAQQNARIQANRSGPCVDSGSGAPALQGRTARADTALYDVVLDVPNVCVDNIHLRVKNLMAHVALDAQVANLVQLTAGADVSIATVDLQISGVQAQALLMVDLDNVTYVVDQALTFIDQNPDVVSNVLRSVDQTVNTVGGLANTALQPGGVVSQAVGVVGQTLNAAVAPNGILSQVVNATGQTVQRTLLTTGDIVERTLAGGGAAPVSRLVGRITDLQLIGETTDAAGSVVRQVRDASGATLGYTLRNGAVSNVHVIQPAGR